MRPSCKVHHINLKSCLQPKFKALKCTSRPGRGSWAWAWGGLQRWLTPSQRRMRRCCPLAALPLSLRLGGASTTMSAWLYSAAGTETHSTEFPLGYCQRRGNAVIVMTSWLRDCTSRRFDTTTMIHEPDCPSLLHIFIKSYFVSSSEKVQSLCQNDWHQQDAICKAWALRTCMPGAGRLPSYM